MAVLDRGGQVLAAAAAHGVDEVRVVVGAALPAFKLLALRVERGGFGVARDLQVAAFTVDDDADPGAQVLVHAAPAPFLLLRLEIARQAADLEQQRGPLVIVVDELGVRRVAVVDVGEAAADADRPRRQRRLAQRPASDVHLVDALVAEVAVAGVEDPMPVVVQALPHQGLPWRRAAPEVVVDRRVDLLCAFHPADALARLVAEAAGELNLAEMTFVHPGQRLLDRGRRADLGAGLDDPVVLRGRVDDLAALPDVVGNGLLQVNVLARLAGPHGLQRVPVVRRRDGHRVDVVALQELPVVDDRQRIGRAGLDRPGLRGLEHVAVDVAESGDFDARHLHVVVDVVVAAAAQADDGDAEHLVRARGGGAG